MRKNYSTSCSDIDPPIDGASTPSSSGVVPKNEMIGHYYRPEAELLQETLLKEYGIRLTIPKEESGDG